MTTNTNGKIAQLRPPPGAEQQQCPIAINATVGSLRDEQGQTFVVLQLGIVGAQITAALPEEMARKYAIAIQSAASGIVLPE